ncbi:MAG TPA: phenylalanine--tRNA ligase subunit alpha [Clostridia bacterium]|nr:phenylalanine--tRNA ligase subunit alpha [Clostridia bacterium]
MKEKIAKLIENCKNEIAQADVMSKLMETKVKFLGKSGELTAILRGMKDVPPEERPVVGVYVNDARNLLENEFSIAEERLSKIELQQKLSKEFIDISLDKFDPAVLGGLHPITKIQNEVLELFINLGFEVLEGPEIETDYYNFQALNIPSDHSARDMQDTFYITQNILLRTHTSPNQVRTMERKKPPIKMLCPGRVYRSDSDASHTPIFHQIEGLVVDEGITLSDLKGTLEYMAKNLFDKKTQVRLRPSYFPFTEPSVEVDLTCSNCGGKGCNVCKGTGWVEILGAGMVHPFVLENCGIDSSKYSAYAFGFGMERMAMIKYGIPDIRLCYENDIRFLKQFKD